MPEQKLLEVDTIRSSGHISWKRLSALGFLIVFFVSFGCLGFYRFKVSFHLEVNPTQTSSYFMQRIKRSNRKHHVKVTDILQFPTDYFASGVLRLPYGDIEEPFNAWYAGSKKVSRIDYYEGMDVTYQREDIGDYGFAAKVVPEYSETHRTTFRGCLHRVGTKRFPIKAQSIIPVPKYFKYAGNTTINGKACAIWHHAFDVLNKRNSYTLYTTRTIPPMPVRYEMMGYDTLLTSYYDHYILDYKDFYPLLKHNASIFEIPSGLKCFDFSNEPAEASVSSFSPMVEFIPHQHHLEEQEQRLASIKGPDDYDSEEELMIHEGESPLFSQDPEQIVKEHYENIVQSLFGYFKDTFNKDYTNQNEHEKRKDIFRHNMRFINALNRQHLGYKLQMNKFADLTDKEVEQYKGLLSEPEGTYNGARAFEAPHIDFGTAPMPESLDWREFGAVGKVRSQGICGSCYAYAVTGALEGAHYLKTGEMINLSEQQIVDCTWGFGNRGCKGGYPYRAMQWIIKHGGLATEESYGRYLAQEGYCHFKNSSVGAGVDTYMNVTKGNKTELKMALSFYGPVTVLINTRPKSFKFYSSGVYYDSQCAYQSLDHAALAVGYGKEHGREYWLIKNSWSVSWGSRGYIKISMKDNNCGVTQKAVIVKARVQQ